MATLIYDKIIQSYVAKCMMATKCKLHGVVNRTFIITFYYSLL